MRSRRGLVVGVLFGLAALAIGAGVWLFARTQFPFRLVTGGGRTAGGNFSVSGGNLYLVSGEPGVLFGTVTKPGAPEELTYVILFRHSLSSSFEPGPGTDFRGFHDGRKTGNRDAVTIGGRRIEAAYEAELDEAKAAVVREALTVGGESKELVAGRVFLVDLSGEAPAYTQKKLDLSVNVSPLGSAADAERIAAEVVRRLRAQDPEVRAFLR